MAQNKKDSKDDDTHPAPTNPRREHPSTYFVQDRSNLDEMTRLQLQAELLTESMGGVLPEQPDPTRFQTVLDVGCGTGDWLIRIARHYPGMERLVGVDISTKMLDYAREQAQAQGVGDRVEFLAMDALRMLEFPRDTFDLVNHRLGMGWLRKWEWPKLLSEYRRVAGLEATIRITESDFITQSSSPALVRLNQLSLDALSQAGNLFTPTADGLTAHLAGQMKQSGLKRVQMHSFCVDYRAGTPQGQRFYEEMRLFFRTLVPFFRKWTRVPDDYEQIYQQMLVEIQQPDFVATWNLLTVWGSNSD